MVSILPISCASRADGQRHGSCRDQEVLTRGRRTRRLFQVDGVPGPGHDGQLGSAGMARGHLLGQVRVNFASRSPATSRVGTVKMGQLVPERRPWLPVPMPAQAVRQPVGAGFAAAGAARRPRLRRQPGLAGPQRQRFPAVHEGARCPRARCTRGQAHRRPRGRAAPRDRPCRARRFPAPAPIPAPGAPPPGAAPPARPSSSPAPRSAPRPARPAAATQIGDAPSHPGSGAGSSGARRTGRGPADPRPAW